MKQYIFAVLILLFAALSGGSYAYFSVNTASDNKALIHNGAWRASLYVGSAQASTFIRAVISKIGLLALSRKEVMYFQANSDDSGDPISSDFEYEIIAEDLPTRWWSLTLYNYDHYMTPNSFNKYSVKSSQAIKNEDGKMTIILSKKKHDGNWIPMGNGQNMSLSIRMYNPNTGVENQLATMKLPSIRKIGEAE